MSISLRSRTLKYTSTLDRDTTPDIETNTRIFKEESLLDEQHSPSTATSSRVTLEHDSRDKCTTSSNDIRHGNFDTRHSIK